MAIGNGRGWPWEAASLLLALSVPQTFVQAIAHTATHKRPQFVSATGESGQPTQVPDNREPALYTGDFGDCLGGSAIELTRYDAELYEDNSTVAFHLQGNSHITGDNLMIHVSVYAYGESKFNLFFDPCKSNIESLCPVNESVPIEARMEIPVGESDVGGIPPLALEIPDFEGQAILRIFSNSSKSEVSCYAATMSNGSTLSWPAVIGCIIGFFAFAHILSSFLTLVKGNDVQAVKLHYAHSSAVCLLFAVYQHIFFSGALSADWPPVLPAFWSNFAWPSGLVRVEAIQKSISRTLGGDFGDPSAIGGFAQGSSSSGIGGGPSIHDLYPQTKRSLANVSSGYIWYGKPVGQGLPLPGSYFGFPGTLAFEGIPASHAFLTTLLWFSIFLGLIIVATIIFKLILDIFARFGWMGNENYRLFRENCGSYIVLIILRSLFVGFFPIIVLTTFQLTYGGPNLLVALAGVVFSVIVLVTGITLLGCQQAGKLLKDSAEGRTQPIDNDLEQRGLVLPNESGPQVDSEGKVIALPATKDAPPLLLASSPRPSTPPQFTEKHHRYWSWVIARYRPGKLWWSVVEFLGDFCRAALIGGLCTYPMFQAIFVSLVDFLRLVLTICIKPYESLRLNIMYIWLEVTKFVTSVAATVIILYGREHSHRIPVNFIGFFLIASQGLLVLAALAVTVLGIYGALLSADIERAEDTRKHLDNDDWGTLRKKYFSHIERRGQRTQGDGNRCTKQLKSASDDKKASSLAVPTESTMSTKVNSPVGSTNRRGSLSFRSIRRHSKAKDGEGSSDLKFDPGNTAIHDVQASISASSGGVSFRSQDRAHLLCSRSASRRSHLASAGILFPTINRPTSGHGGKRDLRSTVLRRNSSMRSAHDGLQEFRDDRPRVGEFVSSSDR